MLGRPVPCIGAPLFMNILTMLCPALQAAKEAVSTGPGGLAEAESTLSFAADPAAAAISSASGVVAGAVGPVLEKGAESVKQAASDAVASVSRATNNAGVGAKQQRASKPRKEQFPVQKPKARKPVPKKDLQQQGLALVKQYQVPLVVAATILLLAVFCSIVFKV